MKPDKISIVVPCFNESESLPRFYHEFDMLSKKMNEVSFEVIIVDDGSNDDTLSVAKSMRMNDKRIQYISFSKNFGKEAAMLAGLQRAAGGLVAVVDADMQDPIALIAEMYPLLCNDEWDCVAARRVSRKGEPPIRSFFARCFYQVINKTSKTQIVSGARDFRLMNRKMTDAIISLKEINRFSKGIFSWVGFRTKYLDYQNIQRQYGHTKWSFWKLFAYSLDGIISFSTVPLVLLSVLGTVFCVGAFLLMLYFIIQKIFAGIDIEGYAAMICVILFLGGIQLLGIGVLGAYLAKVFIEVKGRPIYIVKESSDENKH